MPGAAATRRPAGAARRQAADRRVPVDVLDRHRRQVVPLAHPGAEPRHHHRVRTQVVEEVRVDRHLLDVQHARQHLGQRRSPRGRRRDGRSAPRPGRAWRARAAGRPAGTRDGHRLAARRSAVRNAPPGPGRSPARQARSAERPPAPGRSPASRALGPGRAAAAGRFGQSDRQVVDWICHCVNSLNRCDCRRGRQAAPPPRSLAVRRTGGVFQLVRAEDVGAVEVGHPVGLVDGVEVALAEVGGDGHGGEAVARRARPASSWRR